MMLTMPPLPPAEVTIWIHGTKAKEIFPQSMSWASKLFERLNIGELGLNPISSLPISAYQRIIATVLNHEKPEQFPLESFYYFGWSGKLNSANRLQAADHLYKELVELFAAYERHAIKPRITLITHSHGGNVALNLARVGGSEVINIDQLILLACPVQTETIACTQSALFNNIISIHSHLDLIQLIDPQKLYPLKKAFTQALDTKSGIPIKEALQQTKDMPFFSDRHFAPDSRVHNVNVYWKHNPPYKHDALFLQGYPELISYLIPILSVGNRGLSHMEFILPPFIRMLPSIVENINNQSLIMHNQNTTDITVGL